MKKDRHQAQEIGMSFIKKQKRILMRKFNKFGILKVKIVCKTLNNLGKEVCINNITVVNTIPIEQS